MTLSVDSADVNQHTSHHVRRREKVKASVFTVMEAPFNWSVH